MKPKFLIPLLGTLLLIGIYLYYQDQKRSQTSTECIINPDRTVINIYAGSYLIRSTGFGEEDILDWYKGRSEPRKLKRKIHLVEFQSINPRQGIFRWQQNDPIFYYDALIDEDCFKSIPL